MSVKDTSGNSVAPSTVEVVVGMNGAPTLNYPESVEPNVVSTKPPVTQGMAKRTMASTWTSSKLKGKAKD